MFGTEGLTRAKTEHLHALLRAIHRGDLEPPVTHPKLAQAGFLGIAEHLDILRGLDKAATLAVILAVLAERRSSLSR